MKIGVLTFHLGPNHGGYLQAHCLCEYLTSMGHQVEIINYKNESHLRNETFRPWVYRRPLKLYHAWLKHRAFDLAYKKLPLSNFATDVAEVDWDDYDAIIIGSDVVWDFSWDWLGHDHVYFGEFGRMIRAKTIAYAASTGTVAIDANIPSWVSEGLAGIDALSARDETTAAIVMRACGREAPLVVDPTWLDLRYRPTTEKKRRHLLVYAYEINGEFRDAILAYARKRNLEVIALGYYHRWADRNLMNLGPLEWVQVMEQAEAVVAGTFHGTLYAIKTQAKFVTVLNGRILSRVAWALELAGLSSRGLENPEELAETFGNPIDYFAVMERLEPHVKASRTFLNDNLV